MKKSSLVMLIIGLSLSAAGFVCLVIGSWEKMAQVCNKVTKKAFRPREYDDFADVGDM